MITLFIIYQCRRFIRQYKQKRNALTAIELA